MVDGSKPGPKFGPLFYGLMTEEINHAYDGGLYAELIQNRIFQDAADPVQWSVVQSTPATGKIAIDESNPVNSNALKRSLRLDITTAADGQRTGIANTGYWGIPVRPNTKYHASFYARASSDFTGPLTVDIESNDGKTNYAIGSIPAITTAWKKYELDLTTGQITTSTGNRFVISANSKGAIWFSLVSLFPPTYHDRPNGNRIDLMQRLADLHPAFLRFPGGNYLEGNEISTRFNWKTTLGPLEDRPGHMGCWGYRSSDGLGLQEFLNWCDDLKMEPLLAVYAGYSLQGAHVNPGPDLNAFVQEDLEEIEYCIGDTNTVWGKKRADAGHPAPYIVHYVEIGNEDLFDHSGSYDARFTQIFDAIKSRYPQLLCIATAPVKSRRPDLYDDHAYPNPTGMLKMFDRYDKPEPTRPKVFFGEWATLDGQPTPSMRAAVADAVWLIGLQRDCDTVLMNCYAPLLVNVNKGASQWPTNLIGYDAASSFSSPSYLVQQMFRESQGNEVLPVNLHEDQTEKPPVIASKGGIGFGTWHTSAEFKDVKVVHDGKTLFQPDFSGGLKDWKSNKGSWKGTNNSIVQSDNQAEGHTLAGDTGWTDYTLTLKARKIEGDEGFMILFHAGSTKEYLWLNVGGWGNTRSAIEQTIDGGSMSAVKGDSSFTVETGKWYDVRIELQGRDIQCFVDDKLILHTTQPPAQPLQSLFAGATRIDATGEVILKIVNAAEKPQEIQFDLQSLPAMAESGTIQLLQADPNAQNSIEQPQGICPQTQPFHAGESKFGHLFPGYSVSVIRLKSRSN